MKEFRFRKTILIATLVALFSVLLAACGGDDPTATPVPADNPTPTPERPAWEVTWDATVAAAVEEGKVVVTSCGGEGRRIAMTEGFEAAYPGITLVVTVDDIVYFPGGPPPARS